MTIVGRVEDTAPTGILIVEDNNLVAMELRNRLQSMGYAVLAVTAYGESAIEEVDRVRPDLVLMDIQLRSEMDGVQAAETIRNRYAIPVIYVTANADEPTLQRAIQTEPYGFIIKPFQERELHTTIQMALYKHTMEERLHKRERWSAATLRSINDGVVTTDRQGVVEYVNPVAEKLTGWSHDDAIGKHVSEVFSIRDTQWAAEIVDPADEVIAHGVTIDNRAHDIAVREGGMVPVEASWAPMRDSSRANFRRSIGLS